MTIEMIPRKRGDRLTKSRRANRDIEDPRVHSLLWTFVGIVVLLICMQGIIYATWLSEMPTTRATPAIQKGMSQNSISANGAVEAPPDVSPSAQTHDHRALVREAHCNAAELEQAAKVWDGIVLTPLPKKQWWEGDGPTRIATSSELSMTANFEGSSVLEVAFEQLRWKLGHCTARPTEGANDRLIRRIHVEVEDGGTSTLQFGVDESFELNCSEEGCVIISRTVFGALYGLDTVWKLFIRGSAPWDTMSVIDGPEYGWRGLMLDMGRRFIPLSLAMDIIDGMAASRLNVIHLHLNDFCRFAIEVPGFHNSLGQDGERWTLQEVAEFIQYARLRGVRVVPEVDVPGHVNSLEALEGAGMQFCRSSGARHAQDATKLYDDQEGMTRDVLGRLLTALASLFPDKYFHIGADETEPVGLCNMDNIISLEMFVLEHLRSLGKKPMAWEELVWKRGITADAAASGTPEAVIQVWSKHKASDVMTETRHSVIVSNNQRSYLDYPNTPFVEYWWDISRPPEFRPSASSNAHELFSLSSTVSPPAFKKYICQMHLDGGGTIDCPGRKGRWARHSDRTMSIIFRGNAGAFELATPDSGRTWIGSGVVLRRESEGVPERILGGETAMWTDMFLEKFQCGAADSSIAQRENMLPKAPLMWSREMDEPFGVALLGMIFPKAAVHAAALWRFDPLMPAPLLRSMLERVTSSLRAIGVLSCDSNARCDELHQSDRRIIRPFRNSTLDTCYRRSDTSYLPGFTEKGDVSYSKVEDAAVDCYWAGAECAGITCEAGSRQCTLRSSGNGVASPTNEVSYIKTSDCSPKTSLGQPQKNAGLLQCYTVHEGEFIPNLTFERRSLPLTEAEELCRAQPSCEGITCEQSSLCTLRAGPGLSSSPSGEVSYVKLVPFPSECQALGQENGVVE